MKSLAFRVFSATGGIYCFLVFTLLLSVADLHLGRRGYAPVAPTVLALLLMLPLVATVWFRAMLSRRASAAVYALYRNNASVILAFGSVAFVSLALALHPTAYWGDGAKWIFLITYGFFIFLFALTSGLLPIVQRNLEKMILCAIICLLSSMVYDLFFPGFFSTVASRAAGFPGNSNYGALVMVLLAAAALTYGEGSRGFDLVVLVLAGIGIFATMSRSGLINFAVLVALYSRATYFAQGISLKRGGAFLLGLGVFAGVFAVLIPVVTENTEMFARYNTRFSDFSSSQQVDDGSSESRMRAAEDAMRLANEAPVLGHGTGFSRTMDELPHNIYLQQWVNNGLFGVMSYVLFLGSALVLFWNRRFWKGKAFVFCTMLGGLFSHNILDQKPFLMLLGLLAAVSLYRRGNATHHDTNVQQSHAFPVADR